jgi:hypothetical protein
MPTGPGGVEGLEPVEEAVDAVPPLVADAAGAMLAAVLSVVLAGDTGASEVVSAADG